MVHRQGPPTSKVLAPRVYGAVTAAALLRYHPRASRSDFLDRHSPPLKRHYSFALLNLSRSSSRPIPTLPWATNYKTEKTTAKRPYNPDLQP